MLVSLNPSISNNQNISKKKQNPAFGLKLLHEIPGVPKCIDDADDIVYSFGLTLPANEKNKSVLDNIYSQCKGPVKRMLAKAYKSFNTQPPELPN